MKNLTALLVATSICCNGYSQSKEYTVIANPAETSTSAMRINWHTDADGDGSSTCYYTKRSDSLWKDSKSALANQELITAFDSLMSKRPNGEDCFERVRFIRNTAELNNLQSGTEYMYRFSEDNNSTIRYFKTAPQNSTWTAAIISDFHAYTPLPKRTEAAMAMLDTLEKVNRQNFDFVLHVGDICAWGGSYSFWQDLYSKPQFAKYMWAGVNGNHDNMDRKSTRLSNDYFHFTNNNPLNGYEGELGVCYFFKYDQALFIMLNSEAMRSDDGLAAAQQWVKKVISENPSKYTIVVEHYQWFFGNDGRTSQYARWNQLFDEYGVDLAIAGNNHIYARTNAIYQDHETDGKIGTVYIQTPSSDNERGQAASEWVYNKDKIKYMWTEGPKTVGGILMDVDNTKITLSLYDRHGNFIDSVSVLAKH